MSFKLVRKLIQQTGELEAANETTDELDKRPNKRRRNDDNSTTTDSKPLSKHELLQLHIQQKIRIDQVISSRGQEASQKSLNRVAKNQKKQAKLRSKAVASNVNGGVGNTRGSSSQKLSGRHEPTFNKKRYQEEKKEKTLRDIAKLLKKTKSK